MLNKATKLEFSCKTCPSLLWDILNKATKFEFFSPSASFALQFDDFVPRDRSAAKGPLTLAVVVEHSDHCVTPRRAKLQNSGPYLRIHRSQLVWLYSCNHCQAKGAPKKKYKLRDCVASFFCPLPSKTSHKNCKLTDCYNSFFHPLPSQGYSHFA